MALTWARVAHSTRTACLFASLAALCPSPPASADVTNVDEANAPIVRISVRAGDVTIRTWDRPAVQVDGDATVSVERRTTEQAGGERSILIPEAEAKTERGTVILPAETFVSASVPPGERDVVIVHETAPDNTSALTVTIPADSVFVFAHTAGGDLDVHDYRGGTFVGFATRGRLSLWGVGGTVFAQTGIGPLLVQDSSFDRLRARSLRGNVIFERCAVRQIETTTVDGSIVYDGGTFGDGLARFESTSGNVAVGTTSSANLGGRSLDGGRVFTNFASETPVDAHDAETEAVIKGGGPVVTATSELGNVYLYDGSLRERAQMPPEWSAAEQTLLRPAARRKAAYGPRRMPRLHYSVPKL